MARATEPVKKRIAKGKEQGQTMVGEFPDVVVVDRNTEISNHLPEEAVDNGEYAVPDPCDSDRINRQLSFILSFCDLSTDSKYSPNWLLWIPI